MIYNISFDSARCITAFFLLKVKYIRDCKKSIEPTQIFLFISDLLVKYSVNIEKKPINELLGKVTLQIFNN